MKNLTDIDIELQMSPETADCENLHNAIGIMKLISLGEKDISEGKIKSQDEVFEDLATELNHEDKLL